MFSLLSLIKAILDIIDSYISLFGLIRSIFQRVSKWASLSFPLRVTALLTVGFGYKNAGGPLPDSGHSKIKRGPKVLLATLKDKNGKNPAETLDLILISVIIISETTCIVMVADLQEESAAAEGDQEAAACSVYSM